MFLKWKIPKNEYGKIWQKIILKIKFYNCDLKEKGKKFENDD